MQLQEFIIPEAVEDFVWLGRQTARTGESWLTYQEATEEFLRERGYELDPARPRTMCKLHWDVLRKWRTEETHPKIWSLLRKGHELKSLLVLAMMDTTSRLLADGPKMFRPSAEQWESMEHVDLSISPHDFRTPYPVTLVQIPPDARRRLAARFGINPGAVPNKVLIRCRRDPGDETQTVLVNVPFRPNEEYFFFADRAENRTIEEAIRRRNLEGEIVFTDEDTPADMLPQTRFALVACRAALNLCLMLTHYGCQTGQPFDPHAYEKHRRKKHLAHLRHLDVVAIEMKQDITIRRVSPLPLGDLNPVGPGTGIELKPHWRRGHWRCYPGQAAKRAAGETVPMLFVRPCLVRRDRMVGDESQTEVVYHGQ